MAEFQAALDAVLKFEGGYVDDPDDAGGETYCGISRRYHSDWDGWKALDDAKISTEFPAILSTLEDLQRNVSEFYRTSYWDALNVDKITEYRISLMLFDTAIHLGRKRAARIFQNAINLFERDGKALKLDGIVGKKTVSACNSLIAKRSADQLFEAMYLYRGAFYLESLKKTPSFEKFITGWIDRLRQLRVN